MALRSDVRHGRPELIGRAKAPGARFVLLSGCAQKGAGTTPLQYRQRMKKAGDKLISPEPWEPARENAKNGLYNKSWG